MGDYLTMTGVMERVGDDHEVRSHRRNDWMERIWTFVIGVGLALMWCAIVVLGAIGIWKLVLEPTFLGAVITSITSRCSSAVLWSSLLSCM